MWLLPCVWPWRPRRWPQRLARVCLLPARSVGRRLQAPPARLMLQQHAAVPLCRRGRAGGQAAGTQALAGGGTGRKSSATLSRAAPGQPPAVRQRGGIVLVARRQGGEACGGGGQARPAGRRPAGPAAPKTPPHAAGPGERPSGVRRPCCHAASHQTVFPRRESSWWRSGFGSTSRRSAGSPAGRPSSLACSARQPRSGGGGQAAPSAAAQFLLLCSQLGACVRGDSVTHERAAPGAAGIRGRAVLAARGLLLQPRLRIGIGARQVRTGEAHAGRTEGIAVEDCGGSQEREKIRARTACESRG